MKKKSLPVRWDSKAVESLHDIYTFIKVESPTAAQKVRKTLLTLAKNLGDHPEKYAKEPYLEKESNNYRSVNKWSYKLIYEVTQSEVIILMVFHTSQDTKKIINILR